MDARLDDPVLRDMERRGVDWRQLVSRLRMTPDERLRHLEEFMDDMRALRADMARSRRRGGTT